MFKKLFALVASMALMSQLFVASASAGIFDGSLVVSVDHASIIDNELRENKTALVGAWDLRALLQDVAIDNVVFRTYGDVELAEDHTFDLYIGEEKIAEGKTAFSGQNFIFFNNLNHEIDSGQVERMKLAMHVGQVNKEASFGFQLASARSIKADKTVRGAFPLQAEELTMIVDEYIQHPYIYLDGRSPSGNRSVSGSDNAFLFNVLDGGEKMEIRKGIAGEDEKDPIVNGGYSEDVVATNGPGQVVDGNKSIRATMDEDFLNDQGCFLLDHEYQNGELDSQQYVSFWINVDSAQADFNSLSLLFADDESCTYAKEVPLGATNIHRALYDGEEVNTGSHEFSSGWHLVTFDISDFTNQGDTYFGFKMTDDGNGWEEGDVLRIDGVAFHNEMILIEVDGASGFGRGSLDTNTNKSTRVALKEDDQTLATGMLGVADDQNGLIFLVPGSVDFYGFEPSIVFDKYQKRNFTLNVDSANMVKETAGVDDFIRFTINFGTSNNNPGGFWWFNGIETLKWVDMPEPLQSPLIEY